MDGGLELRGFGDEGSTVVTGISVGLYAWAAIMCSGLVLYGWDPDEIAQYAISGGFANLLGWGSCLAGVLVLLLLAKLGLLAFAGSLLVLPAPAIVVIFYEGNNYPSSHNLIPFELASYMIGSIVLHIPAFLLWLLLKIRLWLLPKIGVPKSNQPMQTESPSAATDRPSR